MTGQPRPFGHATEVRFWLTHCQSPPQHAVFTQPQSASAEQFAETTVFGSGVAVGAGVAEGTGLAVAEAVGVGVTGGTPVAVAFCPGTARHPETSAAMRNDAAIKARSGCFKGKHRRPQTGRRGPNLFSGGL